MIKLIVTDVDGTLVEDGFTNVDPRLFDTILKLILAAMAEACMYMPWTGRS